MAPKQVQAGQVTGTEEFDVEAIVASALPQPQVARTVPTPGTKSAVPRMEPHPDVVAALARLVIMARADEKGRR